MLKIDRKESNLNSQRWVFFDSLAIDKAVPTRNAESVGRIYDEYKRRIVPTSNLQSLTDITNAGWKCILDLDLWKDYSQIGLGDRDRVLKDLMLKSMEVSEVCERLREKS